MPPTILIRLCWRIRRSRSSTQVDVIQSIKQRRAVGSGVKLHRFHIVSNVYVFELAPNSFVKSNPVYTSGSVSMGFGLEHVIQAYSAQHKLGFLPALRPGKKQQGHAWYDPHANHQQALFEVDQRNHGSTPLGNVFFTEQCPRNARILNGINQCNAYMILCSSARRVNRAFWFSQIHTYCHFFFCGFQRFDY